MTHFLNLKDLSSNQVVEILLRASRLKEERNPTKQLQGKFLALIFEKLLQGQEYRLR